MILRTSLFSLFLLNLSRRKIFEITLNDDISWGKKPNKMKRKSLKITKWPMNKELLTLSSESLLASALLGETLNGFEKKKQSLNPAFQRITKIYLKSAGFLCTKGKYKYCFPQIGKFIIQIFLENNVMAKMKNAWIEYLLFKLLIN